MPFPPLNDAQLISHLRPTELLIDNVDIPFWNTV